jgi:hypothetical protein
VRLVAAALLLAACASDDKKLVDQVDKGVSWTSTTEFTAQSWLGNRVPGRFAERTIEQAHANLAKTRDAVAQLQVNPDDRAAAVAALTGAVSASADVAGAVRQRDQAAATGRLPLLASRHAQLDSLLHALEQKSK